MKNYFKSSGAFAVGAALFLFAGAASAAGVSEAQKRFNQERAACMNGTSNQDRATCLKEAGAAFQEAKRASLGTSGDASLKQNSLARCSGLPAQDREVCRLRIEQGTTSGTARQGGILRESERTVPTR